MCSDGAAYAAWFFLAFGSVAAGLATLFAVLWRNALADVETFKARAEYAPRVVSAQEAAAQQAAANLSFAARNGAADEQIEALRALAQHPWRR